MTDRTPKIVIEPGKVIGFDDLPADAIALDGYVMGPALDTEKRRYSFDHHGACLRLVTRSTCAQVFDALHLGLEPQGMTLYLNDLDGDTLLSVWLLLHPERLSLPQVQQLVADLDKVDAHGPAYTHLQNPHRLYTYFHNVLQSHLVFQTLKDTPATQKTKVMHQLLNAALQRLDDFMQQKYRVEVPAVKKPVYQVVHQNDDWLMVESEDQVFFELYQAGYSRIVAYTRLVHDFDQVSYAYTLAKKSDLVSCFDIPAFLRALNELEPGWGGGSSIGGAPRHQNGSRSFLNPQTVIEVIESCRTQVTPKICQDTPLTSKIESQEATS